MADTEQLQEGLPPDGTTFTGNTLELPLKARLRLSGPNASRLYETMLQKPFQLELEIIGPNDGQTATIQCSVEPVKSNQSVDLKDYLLKGYRMGLKKKPERDGWVHISLLGHMLGALNPRGSVKSFGYKRLQDLVAASKIFELSMLGPNMACRPISDGAENETISSSGSSLLPPKAAPRPEPVAEKLPSEFVRGTIVALKKEYGLVKCENLAEEIYFKPENLRGEQMSQLKNGAKVDVEFVRDNGRIKLISVASAKPA